jgi:error-prone DNA polymerase
MICRGRHVGVFQVESRAQMNMLPRLKPRCFYDLVIEVAIVRPGPIQGGMVHPYLRRRAGRGAGRPTPARRCARCSSARSGVPIFQEQVMQLAIVAAGFTPGEADQLRRAMAAWKRKGGTIGRSASADRGMVARATPRSSPSALPQIEGFGEYGFPESHAASFALLVYVSAWLKCHHPARSAPRCSTASRWASTRRRSSCATRASTASRCARSTSTHSDWDSCT